MKQNTNWNLIFEIDNKHAVLHNPNSAAPYVLASYYDSETNTWGQGHYCLSVDMALVNYLYLKGNDWIKTDAQHELEQKSEITFFRLSEIATAAIQNLDETEKEYFIKDCELTEAEKKYFEIGDDE